MSIYNSEMCAVLEVNEKNRAGLMWSKKKTFDKKLFNDYRAGDDA